MRPNPKPIVTFSTCLLLGAMGVLTGCGDQATAVSTAAVAVEAPGLSNCYRIDRGLYRSAQPEVEGVKSLQQLGIKTVINLRQFHDDDDLLAGSGIDQVRIPVNTLKPTRGQVEHFLAVATDPARRPVLVHCMHGSDRTGLMVAAYRVAVDGWGSDEAVQEWTEGPFGFHEIFGKLPDFLRSLNIQPGSIDITN